MLLPHRVIPGTVTWELKGVFAVCLVMLPGFLAEAISLRLLL